jgi:two-component system response regulator YesN
MPGFSGLDMVDRLRLQGCLSRIIFISAYSDIEYFKRAFKVNAADYIFKPVNMKELYSVLTAQGKSIRVQRGEKPGKESDSLSQISTTSSIIRRIYTCIEENLGSRLTISMISKACYLSPNYLSYLFHREVGITINDYITTQRMRKACELLRHDGKVYISDIANQVGYRDPAYFSRQFKMSIGCTPQEYREGGIS